MTNVLKCIEEYTGINTIIFVGNFKQVAQFTIEQPQLVVSARTSNWILSNLPKISHFMIVLDCLDVFATNSLHLSTY